MIQDPGGAAGDSKALGPARSRMSLRPLRPLGVLASRPRLLACL